MLNDARKLTREHYWIVFLCWAGWVFDFYDLILYAFLLIPIGEEFHFTTQQLAWIYSFTLLMTGAGGIFFGLLADRYGRRRILQWTILTYCIGTFLCAFTTHFSWLLIWRAVTGLGIGGEWGTGHTLIGETFPADRRGKFGAFMQSGAPIGVGLATIMGSFFTPHFGWRMTFAVSVVPAVMVIMIRRFLPESDIWLELRKRNQLISYGEIFAEMFSKKLIRITINAFLLTAFNMAAYWFTYSWFPSYLKKDQALSISQSGSWTLCVVAGELVGYSVFGYFSDRSGRRISFTIFAWLMAAGLAAIAFAWRFFYQYPLFLLLLLVATGVGTGTWSNFGPMFSELFPTRIRNTALNTLMNVARATQFLTPILIGALSTKFGFASGLWLGATFSFIAGVWIWLLPETKGRAINVES